MGSEDAKSFPPTIFSPFYFFKFLWGVALIFFSFALLHLHPSICPTRDFTFFPCLHQKRGWLSFFKNLSLPVGLTGPSISEPQAVVKNGIKIGLAQIKKNISLDERRVKKQLRNNTNNKKQKGGEIWEEKEI